MADALPHIFLEQLIHEEIDFVVLRAKAGKMDVAAASVLAHVYNQLPENSATFADASRVLEEALWWNTFINILQTNPRDVLSIVGRSRDKEKPQT